MSKLFIRFKVKDLIYSYLQSIDQKIFEIIKGIWPLRLDVE